MSNLKKRKQTPQASTLLDFFGKGATSDSREPKKPRVKIAPTRPACVTKKPLASSQDIIVIDSDEDEDDDIVLLTPPRPVVKSHRTPGCNTSKAKAQRGDGIESPVDITGPVLRDISAPACLSESTLGTDIVAEGPNVKKEHAASDSPRSVAPLVQTSGDSRSDEPLEPLFGFPDLLVPRNTDDAAVPPEGRSALLGAHSHGGKAEGESVPEARLGQDQKGASSESVVLEGADWNMGDDEVEFVDDKYKREDADEVDIDLTLDDAESPDDSKDAVESCPICDKQLLGLTTLQIHEHVDGCITSLPDPAPPAVSTPSGSKTMRPLSSLPTPPRPTETDEKPISKEEGGDGNVFSTLMTSYKENEAWKEASTVEDRNFRATKANGGRRKAPFYKVLQGMPIAVDAFRYGAIPNVTAYFLTHAHSDHYTNLSANWKNGPIYCSQGTANLIIHMLKVDPKWVHPLPMDIPTVIPNTGGVNVTLIEANHCPGSCLFLFEGKQTVNGGDSAYKSASVGSSKVFRYLHCGDFRASPQHALHPAIKGKHLDHVYLDTTYLDPKYCFPPQPLVISACAELAKRLVQGRAVEDVDEGEKKPQTMAGWFTRQDKGDKGKGKATSGPGKILIVVGTYSIGKERVVKAVAKALGTKVYCDSRKAAILRCEEDPELDALLTTDAMSAGVHLVPLGVIASDRLKQYAERWKDRYTKVIGFRPTGWTYTQPKGSDSLPSIPSVISRSQSRTFTHANLQPMRNSTAALQVYGVPYSEHSSFFELTCFALSLDWGRMIATVNVGSEASRGKMAKWVERWEAERKKRGGPKLVEYRAEDYW